MGGGRHFGPGAPVHHNDLGRPFAQSRPRRVSRGETASDDNDALTKLDAPSPIDFAQKLHGGHDAHAILAWNSCPFAAHGADRQKHRVVTFPAQAFDLVSRPMSWPVFISTPSARMSPISASRNWLGRR